MSKTRNMVKTVTNKAKVLNKPEEKLFFEFTGHPGKIYIEDFYFGRTFAIDGVASIRLNSPVTIQHDGSGPGSPLFHFLSQYDTSHRAVAKPKLPECLIRGERSEKGNGVTKTVTWTIYKLLRIEVLHAAKFAKNGGVHYEFAFDDFDIVDRDHFSRHHG